MSVTYDTLAEIEAFLQIDDDYFLEQKGENLSRLLVLGDLETEPEIKRRSDEAYRRLKNVVNSSSVLKWNLLKYSDNQLIELKRIACDYMNYNLKTGDLFQYGGINPDGIQVALVPKFIIDDLRSNGIITCNIQRIIR